MISKYIFEIYSPTISVASRFNPPKNNITQIREGYPGTSPPVIKVLIIITNKYINDTSDIKVPTTVAIFNGLTLKLTIPLQAYLNEFFLGWI